MTSVRVDRLTPALRAIKSHPPPGVRDDRATGVIWRTTGGPTDDVPGLLFVLETCGLTQLRAGHISLTKAGRNVATQDHQHAGRLIAASLIRSGLFALQIKKLLTLSMGGENGVLTCDLASAIRASPQLTGLILKWPDTKDGGVLRVPIEVVELLVESVEFAVVPHVEKRDPRKAIGNRAEAYSYRYARLTSDDPTSIKWVAPDNEALGYDIEDLAEKRLIEVKGSVSPEVRFYLSANELDVLQKNPSYYEVHFWGELNLDLRPAKEYDTLRSTGYPLVIHDLLGDVTAGVYEMTPVTFLVEQVKK